MRSGSRGACRGGRGVRARPTEVLCPKEGFSKDDSCQRDSVQAAADGKVLHLPALVLFTRSAESPVRLHVPAAHGGTVAVLMGVAFLHTCRKGSVLSTCSCQERSRVAVTWQHPRRSAKPLLWFILECLSAARYSQEYQFFWQKVPKQDTLAYIQEEAAAGSHINVSVYAVYPDGVSKPCSGQVFPEEHFLDSTYSQTSYDDDIGAFLGLGVGVIILSLAFVILMFKKSARKRINTIVVSLMPKWLFEDFPHVENSNVIKSLQEKSEFTSNSFSEPFSDNSNPTIMEIEEMSVHEEYKTVDIRKKHSKADPEKTACPQSSPPASTAATELVSDYKPQLSDGNPLGYVAANIYQTQPHTLAPELETNVFCKDYTSPVTYLWNAEGTEQHAFLLEKINLILNNNRSGQNNAFNSAQEEQNSLLENQWEKTLSSENAQEQTLVPDELVSCLRAMNEESVDIKICFPQSTGRLF
nr:PREDICTED: interleukin-23 receptor [Struthio camelus australis]